MKFCLAVLIFAVAGCGLTEQEVQQKIGDECIVAKERAAIEKSISLNPTYQTQSLVNTSFEWPLQKVGSPQADDYYTISGWFDRDGSSGISDRQCGDRTYDGHSGTDIALWPFPWAMMEAEVVEVIAAADGIIAAKSDGFFDQYCSWVASSTANYVVIQHGDGSFSWYWHLKKDSVTPKMVGDSVVLGEYLGLVGSSGVSNGPHLHFEVTDSNFVSFDPFSSACHGSDTSWVDEIAYEDPNVNQLVITAAPIIWQQCPAPSNPQEKEVFVPGDRGYFYGFFRDAQLAEIQSFHLEGSDGLVWKSWSNVAGDYYDSYWHYSSFVFPDDATHGQWKFVANYAGSTVTNTFSVENLSVPSCGDGNVDVGEDCDDGNSIDGDGCSSTCVQEAIGTNCSSQLTGFSLLGTSNDSAYFLSSTKVTWIDAQASTAGEMVQIDDSQENEFLRSLLPAGSIFFIGASDHLVEQQFLWNESSSLGYSNWEGQNTADNDFATINAWNGKWALESKWVERYYVVEIPCRASDAPMCGDGTIEAGEECDDGNLASGDGCSSNCTTENLCGNGVVDTMEECDDGNVASGDGCSANCLKERICGDGFLDTNEECDDGNVASGDGCSSTCLAEVISSSCPNQLPGFSHLGDGSTSSYFLSDHKVNWLNAIAAANAMNWPLVEIEDAQENELIRSWLAPGSIFFIGASDHIAEGALLWHSGTPLQYANLEVSNSADGDFMTINAWNGKWALESKWVERRYIVEINCAP